MPGPGSDTQAIKYGSRRGSTDEAGNWADWGVVIGVGGQTGSEKCPPITIKESRFMGGGDN